jgi:histidyl-tRNA synthetase
MLEQAGCSNDDIAQVLDFIQIDGSNAEVIDKLNGLNIDNDQFVVGLSEMTELLKQVKSLGVDEKVYKVELKIVRGLDYYTGTVFETILNNNLEFGSVLSGGLLSKKSADRQ